MIYGKKQKCEAEQEGFYMLKKLFSILVVMALFLPTLQVGYASSEECVLYVSKDGSADGDGSKNNPFDSIASAQVKVRELIKENNQRNITVYVREGVYNTIERIEFGKEDSVADGYRLAYKGYENENVVLVSGIKLNSEKVQLLKDKELLKRLPVEGKGKVWVYDFSESGLTREDYGEMEYRGSYTDRNIVIPRIQNGYSSILSYNGNRMTVARYPNSGYLHIDQIIKNSASEYKTEEDYYKGMTIPYPDIRCDRWVTAKDAIIFGTLYYDWAGSSADLGLVDKRKCQISSEHAFLYGVRKYTPTTEGGKYYVYNLLEEIDSPGEYYIDRDENKLYFYPMDDNPAAADITIGYKNYIVYANGARNITFENLKLEGARSTAMLLENSDNLLVNNCQVKNSSGSVTIKGGHNCGVTNSIIRDVNSGISLGGTDEQREVLEETGHYAINNHIYNWGIVDHRYSSAATMNGVGNIFAKNKVHGAEHQAIQPNGINNVVEYNEFYDTNREVGDSGCLYEGQNYSKRGNVYRYNYFHDIGPGDGTKFVNAIYLDDFQSGTTIYGNVFENASNAVFFNHGMDNKVFNNIFINCNSTFRWNTGTSVTQSDPLVGQSRYTNSMETIASDNEIWRTVFPDLFTMNFSSADFFYYVRGNEGYDNVSINTLDGNISEHCLVNSSMEPSMQADISSIGFVDHANGNYSLKATSDVFKNYPDFKYDFENIGYEEEGLSEAEIEEFKSHMIKLDRSIAGLREDVKNASAEKEILVLKSGVLAYYQAGEYKLYSKSEPICPVYANSKTVLPRMCAEALGMTITRGEDLWTVTYGDKTAEITCEYVNGNAAVPLRECFEKLGYNVVWTEKGNVVIYRKSLFVDDAVIKRFAEKM